MGGKGDPDGANLPVDEPFGPAAEGAGVNATGGHSRRRAEPGLDGVSRGPRVRWVEVASDLEIRHRADRRHMTKPRGDDLTGSIGHG